MQTISGIHHVTAVTADAQRNIDFYCGLLGLRLIKLTVNFDDPGSYHLYYGDAQGRPGTIMTFFEWPGGARGHNGPPQVSATAFAVPKAALPFWAERLSKYGIAREQASRFDEELISASDPDGLIIEFIGTDQSIDPARSTGSIAKEHAILGFHSVTLAEEAHTNTAILLTEILGFKEIANEGNRYRYRPPNSDFAATLDVLCAPDARRGSGGTGVVHHVAFRTPSDSQQVEWQRGLAKAGFNLSPVMDRNYFHSIYFREPGGVLFEIATDGPGFTVDESLSELGHSLKLPPQYESRRKQLEQLLPVLRLPKWPN